MLTHVKHIDRNKHSAKHNDTHKNTHHIAFPATGTKLAIKNNKLSYSLIVHHYLILIKL